MGVLTRDAFISIEIEATHAGTLSILCRSGIEALTTIAGETLIWVWAVETAGNGSAGLR